MISLFALYVSEANGTVAAQAAQCFAQSRELANRLCNRLVHVSLCCLRFANIIILLLSYIICNFICDIISYY